MEKEKKVKKQKKKQKEEKRKIGFGRTVSNCIFAIKIIAKGSKSYITLVLTSTVIFSIVNFFSDSYLLRKIVNSVEGGAAPTSLLWYVITLGIIFLAAGLFYDWWFQVEGTPMWEKISSTVDKMLFKKATEVELACYENPEFYDRYVKAMEEAHRRMLRVLWAIDGLLRRFIGLFANSFLLFLIDPVLIIFGLVPLVFGIFKRFENLAWHEHETGDKNIRRKNDYVQRTFYLEEYAKEMKLGGMWINMLSSFKNSFFEFRDLTRKCGLKSATCGYLQAIGRDVITVLGAMLYAVWSCVAVGPENGGMSIGDCIVVLNSITSISYCLNGLVQNFAEFGEHALYLEDVRFFLDYDVKIKSGERKAESGDLSVENVSFKYEGSENYALKDVNFTLKKGERIALVGANGSGKTTLVKLLLRLYDPTEGEISLSDENIKNYDLPSYRESFGAVFQDFKMFSFSVKDNVLLRLPEDGDEALVKDALVKSGAAGKMESLDNGIDTILTREFDDKGANLSVGEAQKVSLARIFATDTPFVILDEPSSALDPIAEYTMFENMMAATEGKSVIFISHRLSSAVLADRVVLMENGSAVEVGTHEELMKKDGKYAAMFRRQAENYLGEEVASNG